MQFTTLRRTLLSLALLGATLTMSQLVNAQTNPSEKSAPAAAGETPKAGASMQTVRAKFGTPSQEVPAVGVPPISRWEYPGYVVFFENDRVLHTVIK